MTLSDCIRQSKILIYIIMFILVLILESYAMEDTLNNGLISFVVQVRFFNLCGTLTIIPKNIYVLFSRSSHDNSDNTKNTGQLVLTNNLILYVKRKVKGLTLLNIFNLRRFTKVFEKYLSIYYFQRKFFIFSLKVFIYLGCVVGELFT